MVQSDERAVAVEWRRFLSVWGRNQSFFLLLGRYHSIFLSPGGATFQ